ncbi:unnamed protein product [Zymoseptoria tritici ST99CH_3D7]|uniref:Uncharacterized protein n=1 Tax=Zymoseptoria tritici (strain ST99CH_3D7) TaxID=1276538 RepID=A0A1X7RTH9_ZYMT9|nr:unnamed protein product [Zymoseptoria tritici ST99CH_3D7]
MAQTPAHLTRYHAVAITLAGLGLGLGLYTVYTSYSEQTANSALQRSNAAHRPRRQTGTDQATSFEWIAPSDTAQLGGINIRRGNRPITFVFFGITPFPTTEDLRRVDADPGHIHEELKRFSLDAVLETLLAYTARSEVPQIGPVIEREGFDEIMAALISRNAPRLLSLAPDIPRIMGLGDGSPNAESTSVIRQIVEHESWATGPRRGSGSGSNNNGINSSETDMDMMDIADPEARDPGQGLRGLLYYIAEEDASRKAYEHRGIRCESCSIMPIRGIRYHCLNCPDFDLCATCEAHAVHQNTHVFAKIKIPLPVLSQPTKEYRLWYPGDPRKIYPSLNATVRKNLMDLHGLEAPQLDALYDQFTCIANAPWREDPSGIRTAMDRRAFDKSMSSERWTNRFAPNMLLDRVFSFYDTDGNGLIGFHEFIDGFAYLRGPKRFASLQRAIRGFDMDGDGFVDRHDFVRLFRAKYEIQKQLIRDSTEAQEPEQTRRGWEVLNSSQPISSIFSDEAIPQSEDRPRRGKLEVNGDMRPLNGAKGKTILDDNDPFPRWSGAAAMDRAPAPEQAQDVLRQHLMAFEDLLYSREGASQNMDRIDGMAQALDLSAPESQASSEDDEPEPWIQEILWNAAEEGYNEMLNPLFVAKDVESLEIKRSREDRKKWRRNIDEYVAKEGTILDRLEVVERPRRAFGTLALRTVEPAQSSETAATTDRPGQAPVFRGEIVPTDWESLARFEAEIPTAPLEDLLANSGYGVLGENSPPDNGPRAASLGASTIWNGNRPQTATSPLRAVLSNVENETEADVTSSKASDETEKAEQKPEAQIPDIELPDEKQLRIWAILDAMEKQQEENGGPARLSCADVERIIVAKNDQALRGMVKSWLEFASF